MSTPLNTCAELARWMLAQATDAADIVEQNADMVSIDSDSLGTLDKAAAALETGNLLATVGLLDDAIRCAARAVPPPATGRNRLERFQRATDQRDNLRRTAQVARLLVLDAIKAGEVSA